MFFKEYQNSYEKETGTKASLFLLRFIETMDTVSEHVSENGQADKAAGHMPLSIDHFSNWIRTTFPKYLMDDTQFLDHLARLMHQAYMYGYSGSSEQPAEG